MDHGVINRSMYIGLLQCALCLKNVERVGE
jgi:hypothetical protein